MQTVASQNGKVTFKFNPFLPEFHTDPYPIYTHLRTEDPIHMSSLGIWIISRYTDVVQALRDPRLSSAQSHISRYSRQQGTPSPVVSLSSQCLFFRDPPDHTRLRRLASKAFNARVMEEMRSRIVNFVNELLDRVEGAGTMDIIADFSRPLPVRTISELLGIPEADRSQLKQWSHWLAHIFDPMKSSNLGEEVNQAVLEFRDYLIDLIAERRQHPQKDLISALIQARDEQDKLTEDELLVTCMLLFASGEETTVNLIGNGMLSLLRHPHQLEKLKENPLLIQNAVEELLRYESPLQICGRTAIDSLEIGGKTIRKGLPVFLLLGSANRDPEQFPDPDRLDLTRPDNRHLAFGDGIHYCLGSGLARIQGQIAINSLIQRLPALQLQTDTPEWRENIFLRGLQALPVTFGKRR
ncbi:cytochrome [Scytonema hofmannii PCC 7110]|uniref:Cytochrome n=1 Tax=Scytonema hofmannii PCC 7110 TaxID=128403 RepID=A0A139WYT4_9CYAN|nr:cytochrome P450 [Scytonema hofmannii]KYC37611.1 cytochrome [Scytonema hofmannii PCC 7110]